MLAVFAFLGAFVITGLQSTTVTAQEDENVTQSEETETNEEQNQDEESEESSPYTYTAQPGDSYTKIARKAIQTFGFNSDIDLNLAEIVAAETFLTSDAGFPELNVGETVVLSEEAVKAAAEKAEALDKESELLWERYVASVDFNTDNVGEDRE